MGQGFNSAILLNYADMDYINMTQNGFSDHRDYFVGGTTLVHPGQSFPYDNNYIKNYNGMLCFVSQTLSFSLLLIRILKIYSNSTTIIK